MKKTLFVIFLLLVVSFCIESIADVSIDAAHFPDEQFRQTIVQYADKNVDGILSEEEGYSVISLYISTGVTSLKGIEYLPDLYSLKCENTLLTELDLTNNLRLNELYIFNAYDLQKLNLSENLLSSLFLWDCPSLKELTTNADAPLSVISLRSCPIDNIELNQYTKLGSLELSNLPIESLDLSHSTELYEFSYDGDTLSIIDLSHNPKLINLHIGSESPMDCDLSNLTNIEQLSISGPWSSDTLDLSNLPKLYDLSIVHSSITTLDVSHNPCLEILNIMNTNISSLDLSNNPELRSIYLYSINLATLDISNCPLLKRLVSRHEMNTIDDWNHLSHEWEAGDYLIHIDAQTTIVTGEE